MNQQRLRGATRAILMIGVLILTGFGLPIDGEATDAATQAIDHRAVLQLGTEIEQDLPADNRHVAPSIGLELEPIEDKPELELQSSTYRFHGGRTWEVAIAIEIPLKHLFRLPDDIEIMPTLGPIWTQTSQPGDLERAWGVALGLDLRFWRTPHYGWYVEPNYAAAFGKSSERSVSLEIGVFYAVP